MSVVVYTAAVLRQRELTALLTRSTLEANRRDSLAAGCGELRLSLMRIGPFVCARHAPHPARATPTVPGGFCYTTHLAAHQFALELHNV
ncbi:jg27135 [Pararge aegeria aegeria]|uniref:Jg27135 protein n=1 Tax=Pararge aegeria aegeria TaxID=348720 RepID=A0A8S4R1S9_9NEOP|nr:jg27135 [Pararge aegeria aegeria]